MVVRRKSDAMSVGVQNQRDIRRILSIRIVPCTHDVDAKTESHYVRSCCIHQGTIMRNSMLLKNMAKRPLFIAVVATFAAGCATTEPVAQYNGSSESVSWAGPAGPAGPDGATGERGATGATGATGAPMAGPAGPDGYTGPQGAQGPAGATGIPGRMVIGRAGEAGPAGATGERGAAGATGAQGDSIAGPAGPRGRTGAAGLQGVAGSTGAEGPTTEGPTGPAGPAGVAGTRGPTGYTGAKGATEMAGYSGPAGATGATGPQGVVGPTGAQGPAGGNGSGWSFYRDYTFNVNSDAILRSDGNKAQEISDYMNQNPSARVAIDGSNDRRVSSVRDALINAGVPAHKIQTGSFDDPQLRRDGRVAVLVQQLAY